MVTIQVDLDDATKEAADSLFHSFGIDTSTAINLFLSDAIEKQSIPFEVKQRDFHPSWSKEFIKAFREFGKDPDPTFIEQPDLPFTIRDDIFE